MDSLPAFDALDPEIFYFLQDLHAEETATPSGRVAVYEAAADLLRQQAARWWQTAQHGKARFSTCQHIAGEPSADDSCKCGAPTAGGAVYCPDHQALCFRAPKAELREFEIRPLHARAA